MYWIFVICSGLCLGTGILLLKGVFFSLSENTVGLLDSMLESEIDDSQKQRLLIGRLGKLLLSLFLFLFALSLVLMASVIPILLFADFDISKLTQLDHSSWQFWLYLSLGSSVPFVLLSVTGSKKDYSEVSKLLHRLILNNYNLAKLLFHAEKKRNRSDLKLRKEFVVVSGLARCGTTGLTGKLYESGVFHSLSYANLPFLLSPNLWSFFYRPKEGMQKERAHGDKVKFGLNTVEALEEFFFKVFLKDSYISKSGLSTHRISKEIHSEYLRYQALVSRVQKKGGGVYLAKNNNFLLRYSSMRHLNEQFYAFFLFRDPVAQAYSLLSQHKRFESKQRKNPFILEYMTWLGHHEFGKGHAPFQLDSVGFSSEYDPSDINYWLEVWIHYYQNLLKVEDHSRTFLIDYHDFLNNPEALLEAISEKTGYNLTRINKSAFENKKLYTGTFDEALLASARRIHTQLKTKKIQISSGGELYHSAS